jgi:hypothetical protein
LTTYAFVVLAIAWVARCNNSCARLPETVCYLVPFAGHTTPNRWQQQIPSWLISYLRMLWFGVSMSWRELASF